MPAPTDPDRTLSGSLAAYAVPEETLTFDLTKREDGPIQCHVVIKDGDRTAVLNIVRAGKHLSVDVRGYLGEDEVPSRMIGFSDGGNGVFVEGTFPVCTVVVAETD